MGAEEALPLQRECALVLQLHIDVRPALEDRRVQDRHGSHRVVHRVIYVLNQSRAAGGYCHATSRHVHRA